jgi:biopolymer transport protein ExbD
MARHKSYTVAQDSEPALDISSLIDVCFLLLIYFLVATTIQKKEMDVAMQLPGEQEIYPNPDSIEPLLITLDEQGAISTGSGTSMMLLDTDVNSRELPLLTQQLLLISNISKTPLVQINIHSMVAQQRVLDVLNALVGAGISNVTFTDQL